MRKHVLLGVCGQQKLISACASAQSNRSRCKYAPISCAYILTTCVLSVRPIIARCNEFAPHSTDFSYLKKMAEYRIHEYRIVVYSGTVNYTAGGTGKDQGFPRSLVAVRGQWGVRGPMYLGQSI